MNKEKKNILPSSKFDVDRKMAGARSLWRANGMKESNFGKPLIAIVSSFTQFVPGHVHLHEVAEIIKKRIENQGYFAPIFNTIAIDDGIAMGHQGMLYSLPSREIIADSVEYMCMAHRVDAMVCISNCDKITPGMLMASMRLNIPAIFVSGGPMEAGVVNGKKSDLVDVIVKAADSTYSDQELKKLEMGACPTCGSCSGMFTANSMNCLIEALGLALPGNGTLLATHKNRKELYEKTADTIINLTNEYYTKGNKNALPRNIASKEAFKNAMTLDITMGGSTNTILHILAAAIEAEVDFTLEDIDKLSRKVPCLCKVSPNSNYHIEDVHRAGGIMGILAELNKAHLINENVVRTDSLQLKDAISENDITTNNSNKILKFYQSAPGQNGLNRVGSSQDKYYDSLDIDRKKGCIRDLKNAYTKEGGLAVLYGNIAENGCVVKTAGVDESLYVFSGKAIIFDSQDDAINCILNGKVNPGNVIVIRYEGPKGGPGMQEMLYPTSYLKSFGLDKVCALVTDGRFSGGTSGLSIGHVSPEAASGGNLAIIQNEDIIEINIPERSINLLIDKHEIQQRRENEQKKQDNAFKPQRKRAVSNALKAYAHFASSADEGAVRKI